MNKHFKAFLCFTLAALALVFVSCANVGHVHKFQEFVAEKPATCEVAGQKGYQHCDECGKNYDKDGVEITDLVIPALGHDLKHVDRKEATCEEDGNIEYWHCQRCGENFSDAEGKNKVTEVKTNKLGHDYELKATWLGGNAAHYLVCKNNNEHVINSNAEGYSATVTSETVDPECSTKGSTTYTLTVTYDGKTYTATNVVELAALGHNIIPVKGQAATTQASGYLNYFECQNCHACYEDEEGTKQIADLDAWKAEGGNGYIAPIDENHEHVYTKINGKNPTCEEAGYKDFYYCTLCGTYFATENDPTSIIADLDAWVLAEGKINALGHDLEEVRGEDATQTEAGYKSFYTCSECDKDFEDAEGLVEITDFQAWISEGGNGYIPPLGSVNPNPDPQPGPTDNKKLRYEFTDADFGATSDGIDGEYFENVTSGQGFENASSTLNRGVQVTSTAGATTLASYTNITKIVIIASSNASNDGNVIIVKVGNGGANPLKVANSNDQELVIEFKEAVSGQIQIKINSAKKSVWIKSMEVTFESSTTPEHVHNYIYEVIWKENEAYLVSTCSKCSDTTEGHKVETKLEVDAETIPATCEVAGKTIYTATLPEGIENNNFKLVKEVVIDALDHKYGEPTWTWGDDLSTATAKFVCEHDETHVETINAVITYETTTHATETTDGVETYTATVTFGEKVYTNTKEEAIHAHVHNYEFVEFVWNADKTKALAIYKCSECASKEEHEATMVKVDAKCVEATCGVDGKEVYAVSYDNHEDELEIIIPTDHPHHGTAKVLPSKVEFAPSDFDGKGASGSGSNVEVTKNDVTITTNKGYGTTQFRVYSGGKLTISASNNIVSITFTLPESDKDGNLDKVYSNINNTSWSKTLNEQARITSIVVELEGNGKTVYELEHVEAKAATCDAEGNIEYYHCPNCGKNFNDKDAKNEITDSVIIAKLPHTYATDKNSITWTWEEVNNEWTAKAAFMCEKCFHEEEVTATVAKTDELDSTCEDKGAIEYTATVTFEGNNYTDTKIIEKELLPHTPNASFTFVENMASVTITCSECNTELVHDQECVVTEDVQENKTVLTASYTLAGYDTYTKSIDTYTVKWMNGTQVVKEMKYLLAGDSFAFSGDNPTKDADVKYTYTFNGWDSNITTVADSNIVINAVYTQTINKYDVEFTIGNGINDIENTTLDYETNYEFTVTLKTGFKKGDNFKVEYFFDDNNKGELLENAGIYSITIIGDLKITISGAEINGHSITYMDEGIDLPFSGEHEDNHPEAHVTGTATPLVGASKVGYTFGGWQTRTGEGTELSPYVYTVIDTIPAETDNDIVLYAKWTINKHKVTITVNGEGYGSVDIDSFTDVEYGTPITFNNDEKWVKVGSTKVTATPTTATPEFTYTFIGWTGVISSLGDEDLTITANFERTVNTYTVTWMNGTAIETDENVEYGAKPSYDSETPTKTATAELTYTFTGWALTADGEKLESIPTVSGNVTYYAIFTEEVNKYTIRFLGEDNTVISSNEYDYGTLASNIVVPTLPSKDVAEEDKETICYYTAEWNQEVTNVEGSKDYKVVFTSHNHSWDDGAVTTEATCTIPGVKTYTCTHDSNHTKTEEIEPKGTKNITYSNYQLVTSVNDLTDGSKVILVNNSASKVMTGVSNNIGTVDSVEITNNRIALSDKYMVFTILLSDNKYEFKTDTNEYLSYSGSGNNIYISDTESNTTKWTISITNNNAIITNVGSTSRIIRYNSGSPRFACYTTAQSPVQLYILAAGETTYSHTLTHIDATEATCLENGHKEYWTCSVCGEHFDNADGKDEHKITDLTAWLAGAGKNGDALGHDWKESTQVWNEEHTELTANFVCDRNNAHTDKVTVTTATDAEAVGNIIINGNTYTATVKFDSKTYTYTYVKPSDNQVDFIIDISNATIELYIGEEKQTITALLEKGETYRVVVTPNENYRLDTISATGTTLNAVIDHDEQKTFTVGDEAITLTITTVEQITVTFNANGGAFAENIQTEIKYDKVENLKIANPEFKTTGDDAVLKKSGYTFGGWFTSDDNGTTLSDAAFDFENDSVESNITLYAKWNTLEAYTLITSIDQLNNGDRIIIVSNNHAMSTTQNSNNRGMVSFNKNVQNEDIQVITLVASDNKWKFKVGNDQYLYASSSSKNYLVTSSEKTAGNNGIWSISISNNNATVVAQGDNTRNTLKYNDNNSIFSCYASGQTPIQIYKVN